MATKYIKLSPSDLFYERVERYAETRGYSSLSRAVMELAINGMFNCGFLNDDGSYNKAFDMPIRYIQPKTHGGARVIRKSD